MGFSWGLASVAGTLLGCAAVALVVSGGLGGDGEKEEEDALDATINAIAPESSFRRCDNGGQDDDQGTFHSSNRFILLVSTMDGYVTALNGQTGDVQWTLATGSGALLSSSITNLELMRNGSPSRLVPSLDGGLYHVSESGIEPVPLAADAMLSSSFRFTDDSMIIGAKAIESYGINLNTGKVRYTCSAEGCKFFDNETVKSHARDEVLVISRNDKTVRAVELQTGQEKWNFSVGQHDVSYLFQAAPEESVRSINEGSSSATAMEEDSEQCSEDSDQCSIENDGFDDYSYQFESPSSSSGVEFDPSDVRLQVVVSTGMIYAVSQTHSGLIYWQHQFDTAIAGTWRLNSGKLSEVDLFNSEIVPTLGQSEGFHEFHVDGGKNTPVLYLGTFNKQLYVQPSVRFIAEMESATEDAIRKGSLVDIHMPKVIWRPYLATAASRTPTVASSQPHLQISSNDNWTKETLDGTSSSVIRWQDNYPFDGGYYLFPDYTPIHLLGEANRTRIPENGGLLSLIFCSWFRIVVFLTSVSGVIFGTALYVVTKIASRASQFETKKFVHQASTPNSVNVPETVALPVEYISRFSTDFQQETCLGKGGFGAVFNVVNRRDECVYAVKRIALIDSERARQKVMQEVKALARLDHPDIVRYYQSWPESPPPEWQEDRDRACLDSSSIATPSHDFIGTDVISSMPSGRVTESRESFGLSDRASNFLPPVDLFIDNDSLHNSTLSDCSREPILAMRVDSLNLQVSARDKEIESCICREKELQDQLQTVNQSLDAFRSKQHKIAEKIQKLKQKLEEYKDFSSLLKTDADRFKSTMKEELRRVTLQLTDFFDVLLKANSELRSTIDRLQRENSHLQSQVKAMKTDLGEKEDLLRDDCSRLQAEITGEELLKSLERSKCDLQVFQKEREMMITAHHDQIEELRDSFRLKIAESETWPQMVDEAVKSEQEKHSVEMNLLEKKLQENFVMEMVIEKQKNQQLIDRLIAGGKQKESQMRMQLNEARNALHSLQARLEAQLVESELQFHRKESRLNDEIAGLKAIIRHLERLHRAKVNDGNEDKMAQLQAELFSVQNKLSRAENDRNSLEKQLQATRDKSNKKLPISDESVFSLNAELDQKLVDPMHTLLHLTKVTEQNLGAKPDDSTVSYSNTRLKAVKLDLKHRSSQSVVSGVAILFNELFLCLEITNVDVNFDVFDINVGIVVRSFVCKRMYHLQDIKACSKNKVMYILTRSSTSRNEIIRMDIFGKITGDFSVGNVVGQLSVCEDGSFLLTSNNLGKLIEFSAEGSVIWEIKLYPQITGLRHGLKIDETRFVIAHGCQREALQRICLIDRNGNILKTIENLNNPTMMCFDTCRNIFLIDRGHSVIKLFSSELEVLNDSLYDVKTRGAPTILEKIVYDNCCCRIIVLESLKVQNERSKKINSIVKRHFFLNLVSFE